MIIEGWVLAPNQEEVRECRYKRYQELDDDVFEILYTD